MTARPRNLMVRFILSAGLVAGAAVVMPAGYGGAWSQTAPAAPSLDLREQSQPTSSRDEQSPATAPGPDKPGLFGDIGKLFEKSLSVLPPLKSPSEAMDDLNARARDAGCHLLRQRERRQFIAVADQHERRATDRRETRPQVRPSHDRVLLAYERFGPGLLRHQAIDVLQRRVAMAVAMDQQRKQDVGDLGKASSLRQADETVPPLGLLGRVGARPGVQQRELRDTCGRLAHDLERDVATHRQASEREARWCIVKYTGGDGRHAVGAGVVGNLDGAESP